MSNVDLHSHVIPPTIVDAIRCDPQRFGATIEQRGAKLHLERTGHTTELIPAFYDVEAKLESMNRMKLDISALSVAPPIFFYALSPDAGLAAAKLSNDGIAQMVAKYPARLRGMATLPMQDPDAAIVELERAIREHRFKAVELGTSINGKPLSDPKYRSVLKTIEQLGCFVFTHPYTCVAKGGIDVYGLMILMGYPLDTTIMVAHLMLSGALDDLKHLRILLAHGGGCMPYLIGRFAHGHRMHSDARVSSSTPPTDLLRRFYFDALTLDAQTTRYLINKVGADHVVIGTDDPFDMGPECPVTAIDEVPGLTGAEREQICGRTALKLLGEG